MFVTLVKNSSVQRRRKRKSVFLQQKGKKVTVGKVSPLSKVFVLIYNGEKQELKLQSYKWLDSVSLKRK